MSFYFWEWYPEQHPVREYSPFRQYFESEAAYRNYNASRLWQVRRTHTRPASGMAADFRVLAAKPGPAKRVILRDTRSAYAARLD
jgi:hypothetical protein